MQQLNNKSIIVYKHPKLWARHFIFSYVSVSPFKNSTKMSSSPILQDYWDEQKLECKCKHLKQLKF